MLDVVVIGGGIAGLTTAFALQKQAPSRICLVESSSRPGGKIVSEATGGFVIDGGPDSFIVQKPWALELVRELGLEDRLVTANNARRTTYVVQNGGLVPLPEGLQMLIPQKWEAFERSPLLSDEAKLRVAREKEVPARSGEDDESVADFVRRRLGREFLEKLAEPLLAHIHVADVERMSLRATYPRLAELEKRFGSLTEGLRALREPTGQPTSEAAGTRESAKAGPVFMTLKGGMSELADRLAAKLEPETLRLGQTVISLEATSTTSAGDGYRVQLDDGSHLETRAVVLAVPAFAAAEIVRGLDEGLARRFSAIRYVSLATLSLGYRRADYRQADYRQTDYRQTDYRQTVAAPLLDGFGFFVPRSEKRSALACTWTSSKFDGRAPDGEHDLLRLFLGGALHEEILDHDDETLVRLIRADLEEILGLTAEPVLTRLYRWPRGYPQYEVGHLGRVRDLEKALPPGLAIAGSPYHGVGLPDCIRSAREAARGVLQAPLSRTSEVDGGVLTC